MMAAVPTIEEFGHQTACENRQGMHISTAIDKVLKAFRGNEPSKTWCDGTATSVDSANRGCQLPACSTR